MDPVSHFLVKAGADMAARAINVLALCAAAGGLDLGIKLALPATRLVRGRWESGMRACRSAHQQ